MLCASPPFRVKPTARAATLGNGQTFGRDRATRDDSRETETRLLGCISMGREQKTLRRTEAFVCGRNIHLYIRGKRRWLGQLCRDRVRKQSSRVLSRKSSENAHNQTQAVSLLNPNEPVDTASRSKSARRSLILKHGETCARDLPDIGVHHFRETRVSIGQPIAACCRWFTASCSANGPIRGEKERTSFPLRIQSQMKGLRFKGPLFTFSLSLTHITTPRPFLSRDHSQ